MSLADFKKIKVSSKIAYVVIVFVLVLSYLLIIDEYQSVSQSNYSIIHSSWLARFNTNTPMTANDVVSIKTWMTFDYINHIFSLSPKYLETTLKIKDTRYPRLTIIQYAGNMHETQAVALSDVPDAVRGYFAQK